MGVLDKRLQALRKAKNLTQEEIAKRLHLTRSTYAQYEVGRRIPEYGTLEKMADFFDVSIDYLVGRTEYPQRVLKEQARQLIDMVDLELTDEEIMEKMDFFVDGIKVEEEEVRIFINLIRANRIRAKLGLASSAPENKQ